MALFKVDDFPEQWNYLVPHGEGVVRTPRPEHYNDPIMLPLTNGRNLYVFDSLRTALLLMEQMRVQRQSFVIASDDCMIYSCNYHKLFICEPTQANQRLFSSYTPTYASGQVRFAHCTLSSVETLGEALAS